MTQSPEVKVELYFEVGCPFCQEAITGPFNKILSTESVAAIVNVELYPFGNSYFVTSECKGGDEYDVKVRKCYNQLCGLEASDRPEHCFTGDVVCQHGPLECEMDRYLACAKWLSNFKAFIAFTHCVETGYGNHQTEALVGSCAASSQIDAKALGQCFGGRQGDVAVKAQAMATPNHLGVPWILVNGKPMEEGKDLLKEVCKAYKGPAPKACRGHLLDAVALGAWTSTFQSLASQPSQQEAVSPFHAHRYKWIRPVSMFNQVILRALGVLHGDNLHMLGHI